MGHFVESIFSFKYLYLGDKSEHPSEVITESLSF